MKHVVWHKLLNEKPQPRVKAKAEAASLEGVSEIGSALSFKGATLFEGGRTLGIMGPTNNLIEGPGAGREVHKHGSQGRHK